MSDIQSVWVQEEQHADYVIANGAFASGRNVETAVLMSLFTDRLADVNDAIPDAPAGAPGDRRGWWADDQQHLLGSRLWLLDRSKGPLTVAADARGYAAEALQWLIDDGVVAKFDIQALWVKPNQLQLLVVARRTDGTVISNQPINLW